MSFPWTNPERLPSPVGPPGGQDRWSALEWGVLQLWQEALEERYTLLHAGAVRHPGGGVVLLPGRTGTGKTTFTLALVSRGWTYFSDDCAAIDPDTLEVRPVPCALHLRGPAGQEGRVALSRAALRMLPAANPSTAFAFPSKRHLPLPGEKSPLLAVVFPAHDRDDPPPGKAEPVAPGLAACELAFHSMARKKANFLRDFRTVCRLARTVPAYRLSTRDLDRASLTVQELLAGTPDLPVPPTHCSGAIEPPLRRDRPGPAQ